MIVLRVTLAGRVHEIALPATQAVLGSSPTADITLQQAGWSDRMARCALRDDGLLIERLDGTGTRVLLQAGQCLALGDALVEWVPAPTGAQREEQGSAAALAFGGYDDDPTARPSSSISTPTFEVEPAPPAPAPPPPPTPALAGAPPPPLPSATSPAQSAQSAPPPLRRSPQDTPPPAPKTPTAKQPVPVGFPEPELSTELLSTLKRTPFFVLSAAMHGLVIFILSLIWDTTEVADTIGDGGLNASFTEDDTMPGDLEIPEDVEDVTNMESVDDFDEMLEMPKPTPATAPTPSPKTFDAEMDDLTRDPFAVPDIGILPSQAVLKGRAPIRFKPAVAPSKLAEVFDNGGSVNMNQRVADIVRNMVGDGGGKRGRGIESIRDGELLVVAGTFDHIDVVLRALRLPFKKVAPYDLTLPGGTNFDKYKVIFWNCGKPLKNEIMRKVKGPLKRFVRRGGYLFTTDWAIGGVLRDVFPGYLLTRGRKLGLPERIVDIQPLQTSTRNPLLKGVFLPGAKGRWWLEEQSFDISIGPAGKDNVEILIEAPELRDVWGVKPWVAATFTYGRGRVLHAMGHYFQQAGNVAGTIASHRLALNFVLERISLDRVR